ncbi:MAG: hypothetical protein HYT94_02090 [Parcubacteria group bacterium]|nr:hypothetical protein [Parcubacteria group bacterium]
MQPTRKSVERFKTLYLKHFGEELLEDVALQKMSYLIEIYRVVYGVPTIADGNGEKELV